MTKIILFLWFPVFCFPADGVPWGLFVINFPPSDNHLTQNIGNSDLYGNSGSVIAAASGYMGVFQDRWSCYSVQDKINNPEPPCGNFPFLINVCSPNPCNPRSVIRINLMSSSRIRLEIFTFNGNQIITLIDELKNPGCYEVEWDGTDKSGARVKNGVYFYKISAEAYNQSFKLIISN